MSNAVPKGKGDGGIQEFSGVATLSSHGIRPPSMTAYVRLDLDLRIVDSKASYSWHDSAPALPIGRRFTDLIHPDQREAVQTELRDLSNHPDSGSVRRFDFLLGSDGEYTRYSCYAHISKDSISGTVCLLLLLFPSHERIERGPSEETNLLIQKLREREGLLQMIVENTAEAIVVIADGRVQYMNPRAEQLVGYTLEEARKINYIEIVHEDDHERAREFHIQQMSGENVKPQTFRLVRRNGEVRWAQSTGVPIEWNDRPAALKFLTDITERILSENALRQSERRLFQFLEKLPVGIIVTDTDGKPYYANHAASEIIGDPTDLVTKTDFSDYFDKFYIRGTSKKYPSNKLPIMCALKGERLRVDDVAIHSDDRVIPLDVWGSPIFDENGNVAYAIAVFMDVSDREKSRQQLLQSEKLAAIGTLAAGVAHEINNPIGYIKSNLNAMYRYLNHLSKRFDGCDEIDDENRVELKEMIDDFGDAISESIDGTERVAEIVTDLKSFARIDKSERENADLNEGIRSTLNIVWNELKYKCKVETEFGDIPELTCMPNQLNQVFLNLLVNAGQSIEHKEGLIKIRTWSDAEGIHVSISDNGKGIPEEQLSKIFEPFYTTKEVGEGTGLGLSLVHDIVEKHRGSIEVDSEVGKGTTFTMTFPLGGLDE